VPSPVSREREVGRFGLYAARCAFIIVQLLPLFLCLCTKSAGFLRSLNYNSSVNNRTLFLILSGLVYYR